MFGKLFSIAIVLICVSLAATLAPKAPDKLPDTVIDNEIPDTSADNEIPDASAGDEIPDTSIELPDASTDNEMTDTQLPDSLLPDNDNIAADIPDDSSADIVHPLPYNDCLTLTKTFPHRDDSFTQGLFFYDDEMYETTGRYAESKIYRKVNLESGIADDEYIFPDNIFAEGSVVFKDKLYVLTYKEEQVQVFDPITLSHKTTYSYPRQGWGLTTDGEYLIASDGTSTLYFMDKDLKEERRIIVKNGDMEMAQINELEYINGEIWANQWLSDYILVIDPDSGNVKKIIDFNGLYTPESDDRDAVLNGIAYNNETGKLYITGKLWEKMFEFEIKQ